MNESSRVHGRLLARNAFFNLSALVIPILIAVVSLPLIVRGLGPERFGVLSLVWTVLNYLTDFGFGSATTRYAAAALGAGQNHRLGSILWATSRLQILVGVVEGVVLAILTPTLMHVLRIPPSLMAETRTCLFMLAATIPILGLARSFRGLAEAAQRFDLAVYVQVPMTAVTFALVSYGATHGWNLLAVFTVILGARLLSIPAFLITAQKALSGISLRDGGHRENAGEITRFAGWAAVSGAISPLLVSVDRFMLSGLLSVAAVAFYAAPYELVSRISLLPGAIAGALYPAFSQLSTQREKAEQLAARATNMIMLLLAPLVIVVVADARDVLLVWLGPEYAAQSATALRILGVGILINAAAHVPFGLLQGLGRPDVPARFHMLELPIQFALAWVLISRFGVNGAALAWSARMVLDAALLFSATARMGLLSRTALRNARVPVTLAAFGLFGLAALSVNYLPSIALRALATLALTGVLCALLWRYAIAADDRSRLLNLASLRG